ASARQYSSSPSRRPSHKSPRRLCLERERSIHPHVSKEFRMKKFICLAAFGLVAWFVASPAPAAAGPWGIGGIGIGGVGGCTTRAPPGLGGGRGRDPPVRPCCLSPLYPPACGPVVLLSS